MVKLGSTCIIIKLISLEICKKSYKTGLTKSGSTICCNHRFGVKSYQLARLDFLNCC